MDVLNYKIYESEEMALLHNIVLSISKKINKPITFYYYEHHKPDFEIIRNNYNILTLNHKKNIRLSNKLNKNIKELVCNKIYNFILMSATINDCAACKAILNSTGYEIVQKLAKCIFHRRSSPFIESYSPFIERIHYKSKDFVDDWYNWPWSLDNGL